MHFDWTWVDLAAFLPRRIACGMEGDRQDRGAREIFPNGMR
jgi:hypothetical protein